MSFFTIAIKNILRRPGRSVLTAMGGAIGIAAVVTLVSLAQGFEKSWSEAYQARGADLMVGRFTTQRPIPSPFPVTVRAEILKIPEVGEAGGALTDLISIEEAPSIIIHGWEPGSFVWDHLTLLEGRWPANDEERTVVLGNIAAEILGKSLGDTVQIEALEYRVCGLFASPALTENGSVVMALKQLQEATGREGLVNSILIRFRPDAGPEADARVRARVRERLNGFGAYSAGEAVRHNIGIQAAKAMTLATSLVALVIGSVGIMNTILMSVIERFHEIAVLLALGWRRRRIVRMILIESVLVSVVGGLAGIALGFLALSGLQLAPWFRGKIETEPSAALLVLALLISAGMGAFGGLYPAWRGARVLIVEGLHHE